MSYVCPQRRENEEKCDDDNITGNGSYNEVRI